MRYVPNVKYTLNFENLVRRKGCRIILLMYIFLLHVEMKIFWVYWVYKMWFNISFTFIFYHFNVIIRNFKITYIACLLYLY